MASAEDTPIPSHDREFVVDRSDADLVQRIRQSRTDGGVVHTLLTTDQRVLARVTDGIYRQPGSALRELISNAYDADATRVTITTDRPRFRTITIRDNGHGMGPDALAHMIRHIGGSAKRSASGVDLEITADDTAFSPGGRRLIGRLGIGLFSVSQLTQSFQVATKRRGDKWRSVAAVSLRPYTEPGGADESATVTTGTVRLWQEPASDVDAHGTSILLDSIRPSALKTLQSAPEWKRVARGEKHAKAPRFHVGHYEQGHDELVEHAGRLDALPWDRAGDPDVNFASLVDAVWHELSVGERNPRLDRLFDHYLQMVWSLSLSIPAPYVDGHPFDIWLPETAAFNLPGAQPEAADALSIGPRQTIRDRLDLPPAGGEGAAGFTVQVDDLVLKRPLKFRNLPSTSHAIKHPLIFVGGLREEFHGIERELSGGPLEFQAYFLWTPKIAPVEHNGVLVRLHGASGTLFDPSFMNFKLAEITRLRQITCEVFVSEGLEAALNIDRESFNDSHPHTVRLTRWLHAALARVINQQKSIASRLHREAREGKAAEHLSELDKIVRELWDEQGWDGEPSAAVWADSQDVRAEDANDILVDRSRVVGSSSNTAATRAAEARLLALTRLLDSFDLIDELDDDDRETLLRYFFRVLRTGE